MAQWVLKRLRVDCIQPDPPTPRPATVVKCYAAGPRVRLTNDPPTAGFEHTTSRLRVYHPDL